VWEKWIQECDRLGSVSWATIRFDRPCLVLPEQCSGLYLPLSPTVLLRGNYKGDEGDYQGLEDEDFLLNLLAYSAQNWLVAKSKSAIVEARGLPLSPE